MVDNKSESVLVNNSFMDDMLIMDGMLKWLLTGDEVYIFWFDMLKSKPDCWLDAINECSSVLMKERIVALLIKTFLESV